MDDLICPVLVQAMKQPARIAIENGQQQLSYLQLHGMVGSAIDSLDRQGVKAGQIVCTIASNCVELIVLAIACWRRGFIWAPFNPRGSLKDTEQLLLRLKPHWLWSPSGDFSRHCAAIILPPGKELLNCADFNLEAEYPNPETPVDLLQTSGTSGNAKFVAHSLLNHWHCARASLEIIPVAKEDAWLLSLPLHHIAGVAILHRCFLAAAKVVLVSGGKHWLESFRNGRISHLSLVNTQLFDLLAAQEPLASPPKAILLGGGPLNPALLARAKRRGLQCYSSYGMTEASSQIYTVDPMALTGKFLSCVEAKLDDQLQILIRGESVALGYWQNASLHDFRDQQGWFPTGDSGTFQSGLLRIIGRRDNVFVSNGENLQPEQIERALASHPAIKRSLVVAIEQKREGSVPVAFVDWLSPPGQAFQSWLKKNIDGLHRPRAILSWNYVVTKNNKINRKASADIAQQLVKSELAECLAKPSG